MLLQFCSITRSMKTKKNHTGGVINLVSIHFLEVYSKNFCHFKLDNRVTLTCRSTIVCGE
jgi:hypothetical protein